MGTWCSGPSSCRQKATRWSIPKVTAAAPATASLANSRSTELSTSPPSSRCTRRVISLTSRAMVPSKGHAPQVLPRKDWPRLQCDAACCGHHCQQAGSRKILAKRINVRVEHINHSKCRQDFLTRMVANEKLKKEAKLTGQKVNTKRQPAQPREARMVSTTDNAPVFLAPTPYEFLA